MSARDPELHHVILTSGRVARTRRRDVGADTLALLAPLARALATERRGGDPRPVPTRPGYTIRTLPVPRGDVGCTLCCVASAAAGGDIVSFGIALCIDAAAAALWRRLHSIDEALIGAATDAELPPPRAPWCAVVPHVAIMRDPRAGLWLADFKRCLAWSIAAQERSRLH